MNEQELKKTIRDEIERMKENYLNRSYTFVPKAMQDLLDFIDSLPEETENGVDVTDFCKPIEPGIAQCVADHWWEMLDNKETSCPKESDDLEKAARLYAIPHYMKDVDENFLDEYPYDPVAEAAFIAGAEWQKEQMMKEAVDGYVNYYEDSGGILMAEAQVGSPYHIGDKVKLIIVKEDKQ